MTDLSHINVNAPHVPGVWQAIAETFGTWRARMRERNQLVLLSVRDIRDLGLTEQQVAYEANKPFWRA
jgi:uncharacterized protein YjiS (DUF1127 family)